ncbi:MAG: hypothetical protein P4L50_20290 [Anaerolineaceae bacterium]|nr:hypothetical protein [Anaerolineaceae bacterium]
MKDGFCGRHKSGILTTEENKKYRLTTFACWSVCIAFALIEVWSGRHFTEPDGISYLDMSDALLQQNWHLLINPYWSPLYPFFIGIVTWLVRPSAYWELPMVHVLNFAIFLGAMAAFEFLMRQVICVLRPENRREDKASAVPFPVWGWQILGYSLFAWSTFSLLNSGIRRVTPDLCVTAFVYLDAGLLLQLTAATKTMRTCLLLGLTLGVGYYAKAALFPMAFVFMAIAFFVFDGRRKAVRYSIVILLVFGAITTPLAIATSQAVGHFTFGESGSNNYARLVGEEQTFPFYTSTPPSYLTHPLNLIHHDPDVFEFGHPFEVTYPLWFDVSYWDAGFKTPFNLSNSFV